ncbi:vitamin H transporter [Aspergillus karnatakaensis]|uniref:vitamin H transporter n=1 Tax=Aspergillus karnatakaensis TaxID=1810916 RepID=UPI003CCE1041
MSVELQEQGKALSASASLKENDGESVAHGTIMPDWTPQEERRVVRLIDWVLLPTLIAANFMVQIDRGNLSHSLTSTITEDLNITTNQVNVGSQMFLVGVVIFELPSNILMQIFPPQLWLSAQIFIWGLIATFQSWIQSYSSFLATRFLLGLFEAGFEPGGMYLLTMWYKRDEFSSRISYYYLGKLLASGISGLLAAGMLNLAGVGGWGGWRWMWLIEGLMTIFVALIFLLFHPRSIRNPSPIIGLNRFSYFTPRQRHIMLSRLGLPETEPNSHVESHSNDRKRKKISWREILETMKNYRLWFHVALTMLSACALHGLTLYTPAIIKSFDFSTVHSNALSSVAYFGAIVMTIALGHASDKTGYRGLFTLVSASWSVITWGCLLTLATLTNKWHKYAILIIANFCGVTTHVLNVAWILGHCTSDQDRGISSAVMTIAVNLGGLSGGQIFNAKYAPSYHHSIRTITIIGAAAWVVAASLIAVYHFDGVYERTSEIEARGEEVNEAEKRA